MDGEDRAGGPGQALLEPHVAPTWLPHSQQEAKGPKRREVNNKGELPGTCARG